MRFMFAWARHLHARSPMRRRLWIGIPALLVVTIGFFEPVTAFCVVVLSSVIVFGSALRRSSDFYVKLLRRSPRNLECVALTFDDGPDPVRTPQILEVLDRAQAKATFFMIGRRAEQAPELVRRVIDAGHEIGSHTYSHPRTIPFWRAESQRREVVNGIAALEAKSKVPIRWFRPPMGLATPALARALEGVPVEPVNWSVHSRDLGDPHEDRIASRVLAGVRGGDIVLMHDGSDRLGEGPAALPAALERILNGLRERRLRAVTLSELVDGPGAH